jgi:hypothetical protein
MNVCIIVEGFSQLPACVAHGRAARLFTGADLFLTRFRKRREIYPAPRDARARLCITSLLCYIPPVRPKLVKKAMIPFTASSCSITFFRTALMDKLTSRDYRGSLAKSYLHLKHHTANRYPTEHSFYTRVKTLDRLDHNRPVRGTPPPGSGSAHRAHH